MASWSKPETFKLIEIWSNEAIQEQLEGCTRNKHVYEKISKKMDEEGYQRKFEQCREKIKKLKQEYKKIKDKVNKTGEEGKKKLIAGWDYYESLDAILGHRPSTEPAVVIDCGSQENVSETLFDDNAEGDSFSTLDSDCKQGLSPKESFNSNSKESTKKTRKRQADILQETLKDIVKQIVDSQKQSDENFARLEEKRLRLEEQQQERELQMRKDDQEFQLRMMQMLTSNYTPPPAFPYYNCSYSSDSQ